MLPIFCQATVDELESKLEEAHSKGMEEGEVAQKAATKSSVVVGTKTKGKTLKGRPRSPRYK